MVLGVGEAPRGGRAGMCGSRCKRGHAALWKQGMGQRPKAAPFLPFHCLCVCMAVGGLCESLAASNSSLKHKAGYSLGAAALPWLRQPPPAPPAAWLQHWGGG